MRHERGISAVRAFLHTIWLSRVNHLTCLFDSSERLFGYSDGTTTINRYKTGQSSFIHVRLKQIRHEHLVWVSSAFLYTIGWRVDLYTFSFAPSEHLFDCNIINTAISSSTRSNCIYRRLHLSINNLHFQACYHSKVLLVQDGVCRVLSQLLLYLCRTKSQNQMTPSEPNTWRSLLFITSLHIHSSNPIHHHPSILSLPFRHFPMHRRTTA